MNIEECFRILEIPPDATLDEVKVAYRTLVNVWHPDRFSHDPSLQAKAQEKLKQINMAYKIYWSNYSPRESASGEQEHKEQQERENRQQERAAHEREETRQKGTETGSDTTQDQAEPRYKEVGGWLLVFCISLTILHPLNYFDWVKTLLDHNVLFAIVLPVIMAAFSVYTGASLWIVRPNAVNTFKIYLVACLLYPILTSFILLKTAVRIDVATSFGSALGYVLVSYFYLKKSKRVRATFQQPEAPFFVQAEAWIHKFRFLAIPILLLGFLAIPAYFSWRGSNVKRDTTFHSYGTTNSPIANPSNTEGRPVPGALTPEELENYGKSIDRKLASEQADFKEFKTLAEQGNASAQDELGFMYMVGRGVSQDYAEAAKWSRKAAEQGDAGAQFNLGYAYINGKGVPQDYTEALKWYRKAAEQGVAEVMTPSQIAEAQSLAAEWKPRGRK